MKCDDMRKTFETVNLYLSFKTPILLTKETDTKMLKTVDILEICPEKNWKLLLENISSLCLRQLVTSLNNCPAQKEN